MSEPGEIRQSEHRENHGHCHDHQQPPDIALLHQISFPAAGATQNMTCNRAASELLNIL
jgi:hypothetical protein